MSWLKACYVTWRMQAFVNDMTKSHSRTAQSNDTGCAAAPGGRRGNLNFASKYKPYSPVEVHA